MKSITRKANVTLAALALACGALAAGCFNPDYPDNAFACDPEDREGPCPDGFTCGDVGGGEHRCLRGPASMAPEITRIDLLTDPVRLALPLRFEIEVRNLELVAPGADPRPGQGLFQVWIDDRWDDRVVVSKPTGQIPVPLDVGLGRHLLVVQIVRSDEVPFEPELVWDVEFDVHPRL